MQKLIKNIPNFITLLNLAAGTLAIISSIYGTLPHWGLKGYQWAFIFIGIAAVADFLDGFMARLLKAYSDLGKQLDSLCDIVSFGVAPALTVFFLLQQLSPDQWLCWTALLIPLCAALRLARFNIDTRQTTNFIGLPVPANAIFWIGYANLICEGVHILVVWYVFLLFLLVECWLMNSSIRMFSLKITSLSLRTNIPCYLLIIAAGVFCFTMGVSGLFWLIIFYIFTSISFKPGIK